MIQGQLTASNTLTYEKMSALRDVRARVNAFENEARKVEQVELVTKHYFANGVYARELYIPAGVILTGKIHKYENLNIMSKGVLDVLIGDKVQRVTAPFTIVSPPGTKRIARAIEDTIWITLHSVDPTFSIPELNLIEKHFVCDSEEEFLKFNNYNQLCFKFKE